MIAMTDDINGQATNRMEADPAVRWVGPVAPAVPPLEAEELENVLARFRAWEPFDGAAVLDDVADALDALGPGEEDVEELGDRLRGHLMRLVAIVVAAKADQKDERAALLVERARTVRTQDVPGDHRRAVAHLRRMGWITSELLERLVETKCLKEVT
ncbi:DUF6415 family natural product biosynthesis protein [Streptomyces sp. NPDC054933]